MSTSDEPDEPRTGVDLLRRYLTDNGLSIQEFCGAAGRPTVERTKVVRILRGTRTRISVDFARAVDEATRGAVPWWSWCTDDAEEAPRTGTEG